MEPFPFEEVALEDMLTARERRAGLQQLMIQEYGHPLICLTLNIPGPRKVFPLIPEAFAEGCRRVESALCALGLTPVACRQIREKTGFEAIYSVKADPLVLKKAMISIEDKDRIGRLFDIDVLNTDGAKISREDLNEVPRTCLLCGRPAHICSRSRSHSVKELTCEIDRILQKEFSFPSDQP